MYKELPEELQEALFSIEGADQIDAICEEFGIAESSQGVTKQIGNVLLGIIPAQEFENVLIKEIGLKKTTAQQVGRRIYRAIFYPVKMELEQLHSAQFTKAPSSGGKGQSVGLQQSAAEPPNSQSQEEDYIVRKKTSASPEPQAPPQVAPKEKSADSYRESID